MKTSEIKKPVLKTETVELESLGGTVTVRAMKLSERMELLARLDKARPYIYSAELLSTVVVDDGGSTVFNAEEWDIWAGENRDDCFKLTEVAQRLSGLNAGEVEKK